MLSRLIETLYNKSVSAKSRFNKSKWSFFFSTFILPTVLILFYIFVCSLLYKFYEEGHILKIYNSIVNFFYYFNSYLPVSNPEIIPTTELPSSNDLKASSNSDASGVSKKKIIIGVTIAAVAVCGVGVGILFIPGAPELIISTVLLCSSSGGFGGA